MGSSQGIFEDLKLRIGLSQWFFARRTMYLRLQSIHKPLGCTLHRCEDEGTSPKKKKKWVKVGLHGNPNEHRKKDQN